MGCGESKGKEEGASTEPVKITFKDVGVHSMDVFFRRCKQTMDDFEAITEPLAL